MIAHIAATILADMERLVVDSNTGVFLSYLLENNFLPSELDVLDP